MRIRAAVSEDAFGIAKVHVDSWKSTYKKLIPNEYLERLSYEQREKLWLANMLENEVFVAENDQKEIIGFSTGGKKRSGKYTGYEGELYAIYILKEYQGIGLGRRLIQPIIQQFMQEDLTGMIVQVLEGNGATKFYEVLGAEIIGVIEIQIGGRKMNELVYGWKNIEEINFQKAGKQ